MNRRNKPAPEIPGYWKDALRQQTKARPGMPASAPSTTAPSAGKRHRRRNVLARYAVVGVFFVVVGLILFFAFEGQFFDPNVASGGSAGPYTLDYKSDGVIPETWIRRYIDEKSDGSRMPPIFDIKRRLEAVSQVREVSVRRVSADRVSVVVLERRPVARLYGVLPDGSEVNRLVSDEGVIYESVSMGGDNSMLLRNLPALTDSKPEKRGALDVVEGFKPVAEFLDLARERYPAFYRDWQSVSLASYPGRPDAPGALLRVKPRLNAQVADAATLREILFSPIEYAAELENLGKHGGMAAIYEQLRTVDRAKYPAYRLDLSMMNASNPRRSYPEPRLIPITTAPKR